MGWPGSCGPRPMAGEVEELRYGQRPHGKGRGEGDERGVLGAPVDAELRQGKAPRSERKKDGCGGAGRGSTTSPAPEGKGGGGCGEEARKEAL